jgi:thioredoxin-like negative regulator of GroEL
MNGTIYHMWSPTCGPCKTLKPLFEDLKEEFPQFTWVSVNTHDDKVGYAQKFGVQFVPTLVLVVSNTEGKVIMSEKKTGTNVADYYRLIRNGLKLIQS